MLDALFGWSQRCADSIVFKRATYQPTAPCITPAVKPLPASVARDSNVRHRGAVKVGLGHKVRGSTPALKINGH
jgi:hypothetical protein